MKDDLLRHCRYYKGEDKCPYEKFPLAWYWDMERVYVQNGGQFTGEADIYNAINGKHFKDIPDSLLYVMFTSWGKYTYDIKDSMDDFYNRISDYLSNADGVTN